MGVDRRLIAPGQIYLTETDNCYYVVTDVWGETVRCLEVNEEAQLVSDHQYSWSVEAIAKHGIYCTELTMVYLFENDLEPLFNE